MKKRFFSICSMFLILVMLLNMLPMSVFAEEFQETHADTEEATENEQVSEASEAYVVDEIIENRTEFSKEFLLSNGLHLAAVYPNAVHYETENGWEEIDNTLIAKTDGTLSNTAGIWDVSFPQQLSENESIIIEKDGYILSFFMAGELNSTGAALMTAELDNSAPTQILGVEEAQVSEAQIQEKDISVLIETAEHPETVPENLQSRVTYNEVYEDTDVVYDLDSNKVKESIILACYSDTLYGYQYALNVGEMIPVLEDDGSIVFYDKEQESVIMVMPAPYLVDDAGEYNYDIEVQLTGSGSSYTMTYLLPQQWLAAEDRAWPVVLDPIVQADLAISNIRDRTVAENKSYPQDAGTNLCGYASNTGIMRSFVKYNELPAITSSDVILHAEMRMLKLFDSSTVTPVEVHKVNDTWDSASITWEGKPTFDSNIEDYAIVYENNWYGWIITDIVRDWYADRNTGMMFKASDAIENGGVDSYKSFISSDFTNNDNYKPTLCIYFRNNNGLESYWDYTTSSAGRAGTGYVNNYTGNMTWVRSDIGFGGNRMPVTINHVYNLNDVITPSDNNNSNDTAGNSFGMGIGWRTNYNQLVYNWSLDSDYYIWEDEDGTDHYFKQENGEYKDEDGLELTLTTNGSGNQKYCITDKNGNRRYFDTNGRLTKLENNQQTKSSISLSYTTTSGKAISSITDGAGRTYQFSYTNGLLNRIAYRGTGNVDLSSVTFGYSNNRLTSVTDQDGSSSTYSYNSDGLLTSAQDIDGYKLTYSYNSVDASWQPYRVVSVEESDGSTQGGELQFTYSHNQTILTDHNESKQILQFNDFGNLICTQDDEGKAQFAQYAFNTDSEKASSTDATAKGNQLRLSSELQSTVSNIWYGGNMQGIDEQSGGAWSLINDYDDMTGTTSSSYFDTWSIAVSANVENSDIGGIYSTYNLNAGETYTFSCYVKPSSASVYLKGVCGEDEVVSETAAISSSWKRLQVTYTNSTSEKKTIRYSLLTTDRGTFYVDCAQMEKSHAAGRYNMVNNGDFCFSLDRGWSKYGFGSADKLVTATQISAPQLDSNVLQIKGDPQKTKYVEQKVRTKGAAGQSFVLSGWAKANAAPQHPWEQEGSTAQPERAFAVQAHFVYNDGTTSEAFKANFNTDSDEWQFSSTVMVAKKAYSSIVLRLVYSNNVNTAWFDGIMLSRDTFGSTFQYDADGNVVSVTDSKNKRTTYEYVNNNLTKEIINGTAEMTYTYDSYHNVKTATTKEGRVYNFTYDAYGNNTAVSISGDGKTMTSSAVYSSDGNRLVSTTNALGKITTYSYNAQTNVLEWVQYPEDTEATRTEYSYDSMYRLASAACTTDTNLNLSATYTYSNGRLASIQTPSTAYHFSYGKFGLRTGVNVGNRNLAAYDYTDDRNHYLEELTYGNGDSIQYAYDDEGRVTGQTYEDGATVTYQYDDSGFWTSNTDSATGITTTYTYDYLGRLRVYEEKGEGHSFILRYTYNTKDQLIHILELIDGYDRGSRYTYDEDDRLVTAKKAHSIKTYTYDAFDRVSSVVTAHDDTTIFTTSYTFGGTDTTTNGQVTAMQNTAAGYNTTYSYTYDDNGNILTISDGANTTSYVYDSANQLIRENNQAGDFTHTWSYDSAGNILSRTEYAYTTGSLNGVTPTDTVSYTYGDSQWGDLLTAYDGNTITSDEIGNMLTDGTWTYTWQHGRQLASMTDGTDTWTYTYNASGMRTGRTDGENTYEYVYAGSELVYMSVNGTPLRFSHTPDGTPMSVVFSGGTYYYVTNLQGDVVAIVDMNGNAMVTYTYDAWGNLIDTVTAEGNATAAALAAANPLHYRGYVYDNETGLYYVSSRYYDPEIGRFINADDVDLLGANGDFASLNLFAYCGNNPVSREDPSGGLWVTAGLMAVGGLIGAAISAVSSAVTQQALTGTVNWKSVGVAAASGFVSGAVAASPLGIVGQQIAGGVIGGLSYAADCYVNDKAMKLDEAILSVGMGVVSGRIGGSGANEKMVLSNAAKSVKQTIARESRRANQQYAQKVIAATISSRNNTFASTAWVASFRFAAGTGISNGATGKYSSLELFPNAPTWKPW